MDEGISFKSVLSNDIFFKEVKSVRRLNELSPKLLLLAENISKLGDWDEDKLSDEN
jgi:hypothetical protein